MPASYMSLFPHAQLQMQAIRTNLKGLLATSQLTQSAIEQGKDILNIQMSMGSSVAQAMRECYNTPISGKKYDFGRVFQKWGELWGAFFSDQLSIQYSLYQQELETTVEFINFLTDEPPQQTWTIPQENFQFLLDLPGMRLIDISLPINHQVPNYTVVFAPRAGHDSNIAEKTALFLREQGLSRMAIVEQKCADDIPVYIDGKRHYENFDSQVNQYRQILVCLKERAGVPSHLVAVCQPGPLLMATLICNPELGRTFGSAGSPMHTEAERGFLTDFARTAGTGFIDTLMTLFPLIINHCKTGAGRKAYDGRLHILGFYWLGMLQHMKNYSAFLAALRKGDHQAVERQRTFYQWYNTVNHLPEGFIKDTYKKIFVGNELVHGTLKIDNHTIGINDYPNNVPIWALGGSRDNIAPPLQATGHIDLLHGLPADQKLELICNAGHMGLFRSQKILERYYTKIAAFLRNNSNMA